MALEFARRGAGVVLAARREDRLRELAERVEAMALTLPAPPCLSRGREMRRSSAQRFVAS
jgi:NAD(P)-dependent dehydrogenase (short-subunit alcohol dehydrogenase family)